MHQPQLASVHSLWENSFVFDNVSHSETVWLGLRQQQYIPEGKWFWEDNSTFSWELWQDGHPAPPDSGMCARMLRGKYSRFGEWVDDDCGSSYHFVCKVAAT